jgi:hypothetical protein
MEEYYKSHFAGYYSNKRVNLHICQILLRYSRIPARKNCQNPHNILHFCNLLSGSTKSSASVDKQLVSQKMKTLTSSRYMISSLWTTMKSASCVIRMGVFRVLRNSGLTRFASSSSRVIRIGDFKLLRSSGLFRFASSGSCVIPVCDFRPQRDFRVSTLPIHAPLAI